MEKRRDSKGRLLRVGEYQRANGQYEYKFTDFSGKRSSVYSWKLVETDRMPSGKREGLSLREKVEEIQEKARKGVNLKSSKETLNRNIERYFEVKSLANSTYENYRDYYRRVIEPSELGNMPVSDIKKSDVKKFYKAWHNSGYADGTIRIIHKIIHSALAIAVEDHAISMNPADGACREYPSQAKKEALSPEEQDIFFNEVLTYNRNGERYRLLYGILLGLSCRINELLGLTWKDVNMKKRYVEINKGLLYRKKGDKSRFYITTGSAKQTERKIPMSETVYECFYSLWVNRLKNRSNVVIDGYKDFVFVNNKGVVPSPANLNKALYDMVDKYNLATGHTFRHISNHIFRHTGCTNMVESGMDINSIVYIMGHTKPDMVMRIYDTVRMERVENELKKVDLWRKENATKIPQMSNNL